MVGCVEIANDRKLLDYVCHVYEYIEKSGSPMGVIFPWLPTPGKIKRNYGGLRLYLIVRKIVARRKKDDIREADALQWLIDQGYSERNIVAFIVGNLFAAILNSGINAAAVITYLAASPECMSKARLEVDNVLNKYAPVSESQSSEPVRRISQIPLSAWESAVDFRFLENCLRDSIRINLRGAGFRRNLSKQPVEIPNTGVEIPRGGFVALHFSDHHMNPDIFPEPDKWDPSRYEREQQNIQAYSFTPWGAGRHPCLGMRFAKLEQNILMAAFLSTFDDIKLVNPQNPSEKVQSLPSLDKNVISATKWKEVKIKCHPVGQTKSNTL